MGKEAKRTQVRNKILDAIKDFLSAEFDYDVRYTKQGKFMIPVVDDEGNEFFVTITGECPRGKRSGGTYEPYDGYAEAKAWEIDCAIKAAEAEAEAKNKEAEARAKEAKRKARKTVKKLNEVGLDGMIHGEEEA